jgi:DNA-binding NtrC family response regulator
MNGSGLRVLVVDDEGLIRWAVGEALAREGHTVVEASDARSAREVLRTTQHPIDAVLLDYRLPDSRDLGLLRDVRELSPHAAVVMMTAHGESGLTTDARKLGAFAVIDKPFALETLDPLLREAAQGAH